MSDDISASPQPLAGSLTNILLQSAPESLSGATQHPFLRLAGRGSLPKSTLSRWLSQDRLYAQAYIGFIGALIARVDLPYAYTADKQSNLPWRIVKLLLSALENIDRELGFFEKTAHKYGLELDAPSHADGVFALEPATNEYIDLFRSFGADPSKSLLQGLVVLWATETVYLRAWTYAASLAYSGSNPMATPTDAEAGEFAADMDAGALRAAFIPNWTCAEFRQFVKEIAEVTDLLAERESVIDEDLEGYKAVWSHVLDIESRFWPR